MLSGRLDAHARDRAEGFQCNILKGEGAPVRKDELLFELETDKRSWRLHPAEGALPSVPDFQGRQEWNRW